MRATLIIILMLFSLGGVSLSTTHTAHAGEWTKDPSSSGKNRVFTNARGDRYEGFFTLTDDRFFEGTGVFTGADGRRYKGFFQRNFLYGQGLQTFPNGDYKEGEFSMGSLKDGYMNFTLFKGVTYKGEIRNHNKHEGIFTWKDGSSYEGQFQNDKLHGQGVYTSAEGKRYKGEFRDGKYLRGN